MADAVVVVEDQINQRQRSAIIGPLNEFNAERGFTFHPNSVYLSLRDSDQIAGGLIGHTNWDWLHIEVLSVAAYLRGQGYGRKLMEEAERIAGARGCIGSWLDTHTFQSPGFYEHLGYRIFGTLPNYPRAEQRIFLMKMF